MKNFLSLSVVALTLVGAPLFSEPAQDAGENAVVVGRVLDELGRPLAGAKISMLPMDVAISGGVPPEPVTDQEGRYRLVAPPYGRTKLFAYKETAGYPNTRGLLFKSPTPGQSGGSEVVLSPGSHLNVDFHLGAPDGILEISVVDSTTKAPIPKARLTLRRESPPSMYSTSLPSDGRLILALPTAPIDVTVQAPGYEPWRYFDEATASTKLILPASERRTLAIELKPAH